MSVCARAWSAWCSRDTGGDGDGDDMDVSFPFDIPRADDGTDPCPVGIMGV